MKKLALSLIAFAFAVGLNAQDIHHSGDVNKDITPFNDAKDAVNDIYITYLQKQAPWKQFTQNHTSWGATFNKYTQLPHRAFGEPITFNVGGNDAVAKAKAFIQQEFVGFNIPMNELELTRNYNDGKYIHVDFKQMHNNIEVLWSRVGVRFTQDLKIMLVTLDAHRNIPTLNVGIAPALAIQKAEQAITTQIINTTVNNDLKIFPYPVDGKYDYRLVYAVNVETMNDNKSPGNYLTYVDANSGDILYRQDQVKYFDVKVKGNVYPINFHTPTQNRPMKNLKVTVGATTYYTNNEGVANVPTGPATANISLQGKWVKVNNAAAGSTVSANYNHTFNASGDSSTFDILAVNANDKGVNVYYHVNEAHDFMKSKFPAFTVMDNALPANVDVSGTCNANYNGSSINFLLAGAGCLAFSYVGDVMSHEYGHGINDKFYTWQGSSFDNGGMHEGYADVWASCILKTGVIGQGYTSSPATYIRRYDNMQKVYPQDITGEVHDDGEIIAGAWWDVGVNWNNIDSMGDLFASTFYGLATGPDGTEGEVYHDVLIDALTYDDDNSNLNDGTPHFGFIVQAFADHGIFLLSNTSLNHTSAGTINAGAPISINASALTDYPAFLGDVKMIYRKKGTIPTDTILMTKVGVNYTCQFPAATVGDIYEYIFVVYDYVNTVSVYSPLNSAFTNGSSQRNLPHYMLVGYSSVYNENFDAITSTTPGWTVGNAASDNATAGKWIIAVPVSSATSGDTVQTGHDHTSGTGKCAVTGNAASATSAPNSADVDGGRTSLITAPIDLSKYNNPVISYWRWFSNSQSANNGGKDQWRVWISYDNGASWTPVEKCFKPDVSWRRAIVVANLSAGTTAQLMFTATDSLTATGSGTWVEAAVDDIEVLDFGGSLGVQNISNLQATIYPNPASNEITVVTHENGLLNYTIVNTIGETILSEKKAALSNNSLKINTTSLSNGIYFVKLNINNKGSVHRLLIAK